MNILVASSEAVPFAKTGGLADVCGALPAELARLGHQAAVILPAYRHTFRSGLPLEPTGIELDVPIGMKIVRGRLLRSHLPDSRVPVYLVEQNHYYDRNELYREAGQDYKDNCERFVFFCRAVLESIGKLGLSVDVLHCNDWQTGLIPAYLDILYRNMPGYGQMASLLTIHNLAYQGQFWHWDMLLTGLDWKYFNWRQMEFYGHLNLLKTGIVFADSLNTVSPRYAEEIQTHPIGCGLESVLQQRRQVLSGVLNGVDYGVWNPAIDPHLPVTYDVHDWRQGKAACKAALQQELGLPIAPDSPVVAVIGRLDNQKGMDLIAPLIQHWVRDREVQWAILGTGEPEYHRRLSALAAEWPSKVSATLKFSDPLAHRITAGADLLLMPSRYEPCGLSQLYGLRYGTVPVVRAVGGLADTIGDATPENLAAGTATGFRFAGYEIGELEAALRLAGQCYQNQPQVWNQLVETGMRQDWSWTRSAKDYVELYEKTIARRQAKSASV